MPTTFTNSVLGAPKDYRRGFKANWANGAPRYAERPGHLGPGRLNSQLSAASFSMAGDVCIVSTALSQAQ